MSKKKLKIGMLHMDIISFIGLSVGIYSIINAIIEGTINAFIIFILSIPLACMCALNLIVGIWVIFQHKFRKKKQIPKEYWTRSITQEEDAFKYTVSLAILTIVVGVWLIL